MLGLVNFMIGLQGDIQEMRSLIVKFKVMKVNCGLCLQEGK